MYEYYDKNHKTSLLKKATSILSPSDNYIEDLNI
jgi:hypothetical protein